MITSNSYNFQDTQTLDKLLANAMALAGVDPAEISGYQTDLALDFLNYNFIDLINTHIPLWAVDQQCFTIVPNSPSYITPKGTIDVIYNEAIAANFSRLLSGTPRASSGVAANAFDGNLNTACVQTAPNGWIEYDYGADYRNSIPYVGILTAATMDLKLEVSYSINGTDYFVYNTPISQTYSSNATVWIIPKISPPGRYIRIKETGGGTLNITELYFSKANQCITLGRISRQELIQQGNKNFTSTTTSFVVDREIPTPIITLWPTPSDTSTTTYTHVIYNRTRYLQDATQLNQNVDAPQRYYSYLVTKLAAIIAFVLGSPKKPELDMMADRYLRDVIKYDTQKVDTRLNLDISGYLSF